MSWLHTPAYCFTFERTGCWSSSWRCVLRLGSPFTSLALARGSSFPLSVSFEHLFPLVWCESWIDFGKVLHLMWCLFWHVLWFFKSETASAFVLLLVLIIWSLTVNKYTILSARDTPCIVCFIFVNRTTVINLQEVLYSMISIYHWFTVN